MIPRDLHRQAPTARSKSFLKGHGTQEAGGEAGQGTPSNDGDQYRSRGEACRRSQGTARAPYPSPRARSRPFARQEQEGGHVSRKWLSRAASVTSFVSAPAVIGVLGLVLLQPPSGPRLLGPTHAGETAAQAATAMPYRVGGRGSAGVEGGLYAEGTSKGDSKALAADLPAAAAEIAQVPTARQFPKWKP